MVTNSDERAGRFFHGFADTFDSLYDGRRGPVWRLLDSTFRRDIIERFRLTFERLGDLNGKTVLDVGCGSGVYMREALSRGASKVIGIDAAPRMLELSRQRLDAAGHAGKYELIEGTFPDRSAGADCAIVMGVMDYVAQPIPFLCELRAKLGGGLAAISFPSRHWLRSPIREVRYKLRNCPIFLYERLRIDEVLRAAGMTAVQVEKIRGAGQDFHVTCH
jgi:cyclopropane fatty-acyl-phospholipid synthase-like methyltransferase